MDLATSTFRKYDHLQRQGHRHTRGIEAGTVYVFPKLDGTNASVWSDGTTVFCGSRNRQLSEGNDNAGFRAWVFSDDLTAVSLRQMVRAFPEKIFYGEWLVPHTLNTYEDSAWRRFWIFDVFETAEGKRGYIHFLTYSNILDSYLQDVVIPIAVLVDPTGAELKAETENNKFLIRADAGVGEGIVVKNYEWRNAGTHDRVWGKFVRPAFKSEHRSTMGTPGADGNVKIEQAIVNKFVTVDMVQKCMAKTLLDTKTNTVLGFARDEKEFIENNRSKIIGQVLGRVWNDLIDDEMWNILKKFKGSTIDFKHLQYLTVTKTKTLLPELF